MSLQRKYLAQGNIAYLVFPEVAELMFRMLDFGFVDSFDSILLYLD